MHIPLQPSRRRTWHSSLTSDTDRPFSFLHLVEMRELPLRLRKGGTVSSCLSQHSLPEVAVAPRARTTLWNEAMSLLRRVCRFLQPGMGPLPDAKRRLSRSLHYTQSFEAKTGGNGPIDLSVQDPLVALSNRTLLLLRRRRRARTAINDPTI